MKVLLVWQEIPENIRFYLIKLKKEEFKEFVKANNTINYNANESTNFVNNWLEKNKPTELKLPVKLNEEFTLITCGFVL